MWICLADGLEAAFVERIYFFDPEGLAEGNEAIAGVGFGAGFRTSHRQQVQMR